MPVAPAEHLEGPNKASFLLRVDECSIDIVVEHILILPEERAER